MRGIQPGELVGHGRTSDVYAFGEHDVVKIPHESVPDEWAQFEADLTSIVRAAGVPAPEVRDTGTIDGRTVIVFERVRGPSMWQQMVDTPAQVDTLTRELAAIQRSLMSVGIPEGVPDLVDRMRRKVGAAESLSSADRIEAMSIAESLPRGAALLHGDLHPGNVLMSDNGPIVIDWFDAAIGHPLADITRSTLLLQPSATDAPYHLPGATPTLVQSMLDAYVDAFAPELEEAGDELRLWRAVIAAGRLCEGAEVDEARLHGWWDQRAELSGTT